MVNRLVNISYFVSFVYSSNNPIKRLSLWSDLISVAIGRSDVWLVMGGFNNVLYTYKRMGSKMVHWRETQPFAECLAGSGLTDLKARGCYFTWVKRGVNGIKKSSKINRALINLEWMGVVPDSIANFLPPGVSGHSPIIVQWNIATNKFYPFRFNNSWPLILGFRDVAKEVWQSTRLCG